VQDLHSIKGQRYQMLMDVYTTDELDKIDNSIEKIADGNKVMETLHANIHKLKDQTQEKILEVEKYFEKIGVKTLLNFRIAEYKTTKGLSPKNHQRL